jgi:cyclophilin family peptidyl-prolyl cis-trans isomerase
MKRLLLAALTLVLLAAGPSPAANSSPRVKMVTSLGTIIIQLNAKAAPRTVDNFLSYVKDGFYDGTIFHRVIAGFMIQGGGFDAHMKRRPTRAPIINEADNGLSNRTGTIAMARTSDPHSATSQFFINAKDNTFLDHHSKTAQGWGYCVFGRVVKGMNVVRAIEHVPTTIRAGMRDVPITPVVIKRVTFIASK